jgi:hypothetical protein
LLPYQIKELKADQEKVFDRLSHEYMFNVLEKCGFGDVFVKWINIFYSEINSSVSIDCLLDTVTVVSSAC